MGAVVALGRLSLALVSPTLLCVKVPGSVNLLLAGGAAGDVPGSGLFDATCSVCKLLRFKSCNTCLQQAVRGCRTPLPVAAEAAKLGS